jgi:hypothetical protein
LTWTSLLPGRPGEPLDDHLHVMPGAAGHHVADQLPLLREAGPADRAATRLSGGFSGAPQLVMRY